MMDAHELLVFVVRAFVESIDKVRGDERMTHAALASEAGVEPYHVKQAIDEMRRRRWISGGLGGEYASTRDATDQMRAFVNPLPPKKRTRAEIEQVVASAMIRRIAAREDFSLDDIATETTVHPGNVRRLFTEWSQDDSGLLENGSGEIDWTAFTVPYLEAMIADPVDWKRDHLVVLHNHQGDTIKGDKHEVVIRDATVGAVAVGARAVATGAVNDSIFSPGQVRTVLTSANHALVDAEDSLSDGEHEELHQLLRLLKNVQVDVADLVESQHRAKAVLDDLFASGAARQLKAGPSNAALEVVKSLVASPVFAEVVKAIVAGGTS